jgi:hypothetical protein
MADICPYSEPDGYGKFYCEVKNDYVSREMYDKHCYGPYCRKFLDCPIYEREDKRRKQNGEPELKKWRE